MILEYSALMAGLFLALLAYLHIARKKSILDQPNHRSSHEVITIRGGGIVVPLAILLYAGLYQCYGYFALGMLFISGVSLVDDISPLSSRVRILFHFAAVGLLFWQVEIYTLHWVWIIVALILVVGWINSVNFMDGINGITGIYALVGAITLRYVNQVHVPFISDELLDYFIIALLVFGWFNFRKKALCFAGDIGSVSIAFLLGFCVLKLIIQAHAIGFLAFFMVYAIDSVGTIVERLIKKQNIFEPHRLHLYQRLANDLKIPHLYISLAYGLAQLVINLFVMYIWNSPEANSYLAILLLSLASIYIFTKQNLFKALSFKND